MGSENGTRKIPGLIRIGELAQRAGTTMRTIRYYEERGLIEPAARTKGGFRLYHEGELRKLHLIRSLQVLDIPLAQVKDFFDKRCRGVAASEIAPALQEVLRTHLEEIGRRAANYCAMRESVRETIAILDSCARCPHEPSPTICGLCHALLGRKTIPLHMQAVIESASCGVPESDRPGEACVPSVCAGEWQGRFARGKPTTVDGG